LQFPFWSSCYHISLFCCARCCGWPSDLAWETPANGICAPTSTPTNTPTITNTPTGTLPTFTRAPTTTITPTFTLTPRPTICANYVFATSTAVALVPGTTDIGNHCDDCITTVNLPFTYYLYGRACSVVYVDSNGNL